MNSTAHTHSQTTSHLPSPPPLTQCASGMGSRQPVYRGKRKGSCPCSQQFMEQPSSLDGGYGQMDECANHRKYRRQKLKELRHSCRLLPPASPHFTHHQSSYTRQAQTNSTPSDLSHHRILTCPGLPNCQVFGSYPNIQHTY